MLGKTWKVFSAITCIAGEAIVKLYDPWCHPDCKKLTVHMTINKSVNLC